MKRVKFLKSIIVLVLLFRFFGTQLFATDTLKLMHYNLMQYSNMYGGCTNFNNSLFKKDSALREILAYVQPDILTVNEIGKQEQYPNRILDSCLNISGITHWKRGQLTQTSGGTSNSLANMIFYNSQKLVMYSHFYVTNSVRDFNIYRLYANNSGLISGDTAFLVVIVAHLKAGSTSADAEGRTAQANTLMHQLDIMGLADNYILCGDFNIYTSEEAAYQLFVNNSNPSIRFYDPINRSGKWNTNASFADIHTQSTHTSGGCFASGGMDDRFDFILVSEKVLNGLDKIRALTDTYHAVGQDGNRFNQSVNIPNNTSVPASVANALYNMSDHLPISMLLAVENNVSVRNYAENFNVLTNNPVENQLNIFISSSNAQAYSMQIVSLLGVVLKEKSLPLSTYISYNLDISDLPQGIYCLIITNENGDKTIRKIIKK